MTVWLMTDEMGRPGKQPFNEWVDGLAHRLKASVNARELNRLTMPQLIEYMSLQLDIELMVAADVAETEIRKATSYGATHENNNPDRRR